MTQEEKKLKKKLYDIEYRKKNKEKIKQVKKKWAGKNKDKVLAQRLRNKNKKKESDKKYAKANKEKINLIKKKWAKENPEKRKISKTKHFLKRLSVDPLFKLKHNISCSIRQSMKRHGYSKKSRSCEILGCSFEMFKQHIESLWQPWMNWDNYGKYDGTPNYGWDIDHITPLSSAKIEQDVINLNHYSNLQPLCSYINRDVKRNH